jgi:hypothetical protein
MSIIVTMLLCLPLMHSRVFTHESIAHCLSADWTGDWETWEEHHQSRPRKPTGCVPRLVCVFQAPAWMGILNKLCDMEYLRRKERIE